MSGKETAYVRKLSSEDELCLSSIVCPMCRDDKIIEFYSDKNRNYFQCSRCDLIFVSHEQFLSPAKEKERYDLHTNNPNDINYRNFLKRILDPINLQIPQNSLGLDFGCGPGPTLSLMFQDAGHRVELFDPFYKNNTDVFNHSYDFITATEVIEHLHNPYNEIKELWNCLKPNGLLGFMTGFVMDKKTFSSWYYIRDLTHVCFYSKATFLWLAADLNASVSFSEPDIAILTKNY